MRAAVCAAVIALLFGMTACKELFANIEEELGYWAAEAVITGFRAASPVSVNAAGVQCVPSASDAVLTFTVRNPKNFTFKMPNSPGAPSDIVTFGDDKVKGMGGAKPVYGTDYMLEPTPDGKALKLTYTDGFLKANERSRANIGAAITLYSTDGRKFNQTYKFDLEANTPPPDPAPVLASDDSHIALFKTHTTEPDGKYYYVLCFKVTGFAESGATDLHSDLTHVYVSKNGGAETPYSVTLNSGGFDISQADGAFIAKTDTDSLSNAEAGVFSGSPQPDGVPSGPWVLYLKTNIPVGGAAAKYGIRLFDGKLYSAQATQTIGKRALPAPKVFAHTDIDNVAAFGVYTEGSSIAAPGSAATVDVNDLNGGGAHNGNESDPIPVYSAYGSAVKLTIKRTDGNPYPAGVAVRPGVQLISSVSLSDTIGVTAGQSAVVTLPAPADAGGEAVYKVSFKATGEGFDDSTARTLYYKVRRELKTVNNLPVWYMLKAAIGKIPLGGAGTVKISGILKAESIGYPPHPDGTTVENHTDIEVSGEKDSGDYPGRTVTVIGDNKASSILDANNLCSVFTIEYNGKLILKNVTLQNAKNDDGGYGGGINIGDNGSSLVMTDTDIKNCTVTAGPRLGGAIYIREGGSLTVGSGCVISNNTASGGNGDGIYVQSGGTFNIAGDAKINENNDVYLKKNEDLPYDSSKNAKLTVTAPLTGTHTVAKITPEDYTVGVAAVNAASGVDIGGYAGRFKITDEPNSSPPPSTVSWKLIYNSNNTLVLKANVPITVYGTNPNAWKTLKEAIEAAIVEDDDEFIIIGTIKATNVPGNSGEITVRKKISIKKGGTSKPVLDANSNHTGTPPPFAPATPHRIFTVENGGELKLDDIQLENGNAGNTESGGAILIKEGGAANIKNTSIYGCKARSGGAISNTGLLSLSLCSIGINGRPNKAEFAGGIYSYYKTFDFENCTIMGTNICYNEADEEGGGILIMGGKCIIGSENSVPTLIDHNVCSGSSTNAGGGGLYIDASGVCTIRGGTKISNNSSKKGGGIYDGGNLKIEGSLSEKVEIFANSVTGTGTFGNGGGIYQVRGVLKTKHTEIKNNSAAKNGGGIYVTGDASCTLDSVTMQGNTANNGKGSAVYVSRTVDKTPTFTLKGDIQIGTNASNSNTIGLGCLLTGSSVRSTFVSAKSSDLTNTSHINIEPEFYIWQSNQNLIRGEGIGLKTNLFHLTNIPTSKGNWQLTYMLGGIPDHDKVALERTSANLTASGTGSWKALKETIASLPSNGGTLTLNGTFKATSGDDSGEIKVEKVLTIDGGSSAVIDADGKCRIFRVEVALTLKDITLENGSALGDSSDKNGGGVYVTSTGQFTMQGSTCIKPPTMPPGVPPIAGINDVYLKNERTITVEDALTGTLPVARITPENYSPTTQVLDGDITAGTAPNQNYKKFTVTPEDLGGGTMQDWEVDENGKLKTQ